jgi:hypothetical protein
MLNVLLFCYPLNDPENRRLQIFLFFCIFFYFFAIFFAEKISQSIHGLLGKRSKSTETYLIMKTGQKKVCGINSADLIFIADFYQLL